MKNPFIALKEVFFGDTESEEYYSEEDLYKKAYTEKYISEEVRKELIDSLKNLGNGLKNKKRGFKVDRANGSNSGGVQRNPEEKEEEIVR